MPWTKGVTLKAKLKTLGLKDKNINAIIASKDTIADRKKLMDEVNKQLKEYSDKKKDIDAALKECGF